MPSNEFLFIWIKVLFMWNVALTLWLLCLQNHADTTPDRIDPLYFGFSGDDSDEIHHATRYRDLITR